MEENMSLLDESMTDFVIMNKATVNDGYGGYEIQWSDGATIQAAIDVPDSALSLIADKQTERKNCHVITSRAVLLQVNDVLRRVVDGLYFRIQEDGTDNKTPASAALDMRSCKAEILRTLPDGGNHG
jgi:hypothetical protein